MPNFYRRNDEAQIMDTTAKATRSVAHKGLVDLDMVLGIGANAVAFWSHHPARSRFEYLIKQPIETAPMGPCNARRGQDLYRLGAGPPRVRRRP
jgi:hypothetical protein